MDQLELLLRTNILCLALMTCLTSCKEHKYFLRLTLFWLPLVKNLGIPKIAFWARYGHYEFLMMLFGLIIAPATSEDLMNVAFHD